MSLYTSTYLRSLTANTPLLESTNMFSVGRSKNSFDIFLSHSYLDRVVVQGLYIELTKLGYSVYVDWIIDPNLDRANVTKESAKRVQGRLKSSKSLLLGISANATMSKWMPWELGYVDGNTSRCAIIPVSDMVNPPSSYTGVEYLSLYPYIAKFRDVNFTNKLWAIETSNKYVPLNEWVVGAQPLYRAHNLY